MEQELERPLVHRDAHGVGHRDATLAGPTATPGDLSVISNAPTPARATPVRFPLMTRQFSGIQPTGDMHLGNFVGAVKRWVDQQDDGIFCVVDLHAMTMPYDAAELTAGTRRLAALLFAAGLDPARCTLFVQSHVPVVTELTWVLNGVATFGELGRMTQFKEKGAGQESVSAGLFDYPVLMAADILLYDTDEVPVGEDQVQHVELTRDVAIRFNHRFGDTLVVPKATLPPVGARIKDLQHPTAKMSKSVDSPQGTILVLDEPKAITKKVKSAVTDSGHRGALRRRGQARRLEPAVAVVGRVRAAHPRPRGRVRHVGLRHVQGRGRRRARRVPAADARAVPGAGRGPGRAGPTPRARRRPRERDRRRHHDAGARRDGPPPRVVTP